MLDNNNPAPILHLSFTQYFKMSKVPFNSSIEVNDLCITPQFNDALSRLLYAAQNRQFAVLTAPVGCGKSTLLRKLSSYLKEDEYLVIYISQSNLRPRWLYNLALSSLGCEPKYYSTDAKKLFHDYLNKVMSVDKKNVVMIIDEAHLVPSYGGGSKDTLEEIRFLLNCEFDAGNPLCLILSGQEELWNVLSTEKSKAICQRIDICCTLLALDDTQVRNYIDAHLKYSGVTERIFTDEAIENISNASKGVPRLINKICTQSLLYASTMAKSMVDKELVNKVLEVEIPKCLL